MTNAMRFGTVNSIGFIFTVLGVLFIACANGAGVYAVLHYVPQFKGIVTSWVGPVVVACVEGALIGVCFMSVYSFASDTMLQAFMVDSELDRPDGMRPALVNDFIETLEKNHKGSGGNDVKPESKE